MKTLTPTKLSRSAKFSAYSAMAVSIGAIGELKGQIIYTDIDPDISLHTTMGELLHENIYLDVNDDAINDFAFYIHCDPASDTSYHTFKVGLFDGSVMGFFYYASNLSAGDPINGDMLWKSYSASMASITQYGVNPSFYGFWVNAEDRYLGIRIPFEGDYKYGWMRLSYLVNYDDIPFILEEFSIKDYAINSVPGEGLTAGEGVPVCEAPIPTGTFNIMPTGAKFKWEVVEPADGYQIFYRAVGAGPWQKKLASSNQKLVGGLTCNTNYEWKVRAKCGVDVTGFSPIQTFTTSDCRIEGEQDDIFEIMSVYPNPASEILFVETNLLNKQFELVIIDMLGNKIEQINYTIDEEMIQLQTANLPAGMYVLNISTQADIKSVSFVKQ